MAENPNQFPKPSPAPIPVNGCPEYAFLIPCLVDLASGQFRPIYTLMDFPSLSRPPSQEKPKGVD